MAVINALKSGNWSDPSVWPNNTAPGLNDEVHANGFTVTLNINVTVAELTTAAKNGGGAGGGFTLNNNITVRATITSGTTICITTAATCYTASIIGNVTGGSASGAYGVYSTSTSTVTINGNVTGGSASGAYGVCSASTSTVTINGNVTGGSASGAYGVYSTSTSTVTINGNVTGGSASGAHGVCSASTSTVTINGNVTGGSTPATPAIYSIDASTTIIDGTAEFSITGQSPFFGNIRFKRRDTIAFNILTDSGMMQLRPCPYTDQPVINLPIPQTGQAVAWVKCIDQTGAPVAGVPVSIQHVDGGKSGVIHISQPLTGVSDNNGLTTFAIPRIAGLKYQLWTEGKSVKKLFVSKDAESYEIPVSVITEAKEFGQK